MSIPPSLSPLVIINATQEDSHTLEIFLDYVCPFSAKMAKAIDGVLSPLLKSETESKFSGRVKVVFRPQVQPWHASSTLTHEAALAMARVSPKYFWPFAQALFEHQEEYFDIPSSNQTPVQIRDSLAKLANEVLKTSDGASFAKKATEEFRDALQLKGSANGGVAVTEDLKYTVKYSRQNGIHVSPTVIWDGIIANEVSSSWGLKEWKDFFAEKVKM
ncbi:hypothetical protein BDV98DRAFT_243003 [Pterulicium gracile]|uniref:Thioredoxin-like fold domain-containing protein n=1 Tax=Pterulicium gracile TaxID=1884261 RepID=A0A5C3QXC3_9AGAR|nr:hypothetical protein BDV98DRAFT_243003 [Pterula gracilis]